MRYISRFFKDDEFQRVACTRADICDDSLARLDIARGKAGVPFRITSAYRTEEHNRKVGGTPNSAHLRGRAFDIACRNSYERALIVQSCLEAGFPRIGIGATFVHVDDDTSLPHPRIWLY